MNAFMLPGWRFAMSLVGGAFLVAGALAANPSVSKSASGTPGIVAYQAPDGERYAALILPAPAVPATRAAVQTAGFQHVVIVDTSASQTGQYRTRSLNLLNA